MVKRSGKNSVSALWRAPAATVACLVLLICIEALLVQKSVISVETAKIGLIVCCLIAGSAGALMKARGEGGKMMLLAALVLPALLLLVMGIVLNKQSSLGFAPFVHAACLMIPGVISVICGRGRRNSRQARKKRRIPKIQ